MITHYKLLEINNNASTEEINKAWKLKSKEYHPDKNNNSSSAERMTQLINAAKECLSDPVRRKQYDLSIKLQPKFVIQQNEKQKGNSLGAFLLGALTWAIFKN